MPRKTKEPTPMWGVCNENGIWCGFYRDRKDAADRKRGLMDFLDGRRYRIVKLVPERKAVRRGK